MSVHEIKRTSLLDVPQRLRELANEIERRGDTHRSIVVVVAYPGGKVTVRAYGERTSALEVSGYLARGQSYMTERCGVEGDNFSGDPMGAA